MTKNILVDSEQVRNCVNKIADIIRAEQNRELTPVETYAEPTLIERFINSRNDIIYGRRGTGKTHLLLAIQEKLINDSSDKITIPVYVDLTKIIPLIDSSSEDLFKIEFCIHIIEKLIEQIFEALSENLNYITNSGGNVNMLIEDVKKDELVKIFSSINKEFNVGRSLVTLGKYAFNAEDIKSLSASFNISTNPSIETKASKDTKKEQKNEFVKYISISELHLNIQKLFKLFPHLRLTLLIDEFSEVENKYQPILATLIKKIIITSGITVKIAAIPNRTNLQLISENIIGLQEGADIFGFHLDNRYIFEVNPAKTKSFFNALLLGHLKSIILLYLTKL